MRRLALLLLLGTIVGCGAAGLPRPPPPIETRPGATPDAGQQP